MKRIFTFIVKIIAHKWLGASTPMLYLAMIEPKEKSYSWYWKQSRNGVDGWS